jgi:HPt (histidine-containing phosphotransfer) domain-containing protein
MVRLWLQNPVLRVQLRALNLERAIELDALTAPGEPSLLLELTKLFQEAAPPIVQTIKKALNESSYEKVARAVHSLKSSAGNIGALKLSEMCQELETKAGKDSSTPISILRMNFFELNVEYETLMSEIRILHRLAA